MILLALTTLLAQAPLAADAGEAAAPAAEPAALATPAAATPAADAAPAPADEDLGRVTVVTGSRTERLAADAVVSTEVITRTQIEALGVRDLVQLLQQQPGAEVVYTNRGVGLRLQGVDPQYVLILVDGERVAGRSGPFTDISRFSLREVERVEIVKGPAAALYGADAIGGVVNIITRRPQKLLEGAIRGMYGSLNELDVRGNIGSKLGDFELRAGGGYRMRNPYDWSPPPPEGNGFVDQNLPGVHRFDADAEAAWVPSEKLRVWLRAGYVFTDLNAIDVNANGATTADQIGNGFPPPAIFDRYQRTEQFDTWAGVVAGVGADTTLTVRGHFGLFRDQFLVDQRGKGGPLTPGNGQGGALGSLDSYTQNLTTLYEALVQVDHRVGRHHLTAGVEGYGERLVSDRLVPGDVNRGRVGVYVQDEWVLASVNGGPKVALEPGLRVDVDTQFGAAPSPRLAVKVDPIPELTFRAAWGLGFRPPSFQELYLDFANTAVGYIVKGNAGLIAEHSGSVNLGVDWRLPWEGAMLSASVWHTSFTDQINVSADGLPDPNNPVVFRYENIANSYTQGVEVSGRFKLSKGTYLDLGYMGTDAWDITRNRPLEGSSPHRVNASLSSKYRPFGLEGVVRATWNSPRPYYGGSGTANSVELGTGALTAPGYVDLEVQLTYSRYFFKLFINGYNLLNAGDATYNPRPPRGVIGGVLLEL